MMNEQSTEVEKDEEHSWGGARGEDMGGQETQDKYLGKTAENTDDK